MKKTYELYFPLNEKDGRWTELITYSVDGIESWAIWSDIYSDWIPVNISKLQCMFPQRWDKITDFVREKYETISKESRIDDLIMGELNK